MDLSALIAAAVTLLCLTQASTQNGLCPPEPVVVHLSRGQKVTVRYWVGEEVLQEVTEVPKLTRRPPRPVTTTTSSDDLHGRLGEHNTTATLPTEDAEASTISSSVIAETTTQGFEVTSAENEYNTDVNSSREAQPVSEAPQPESGDSSKEHDAANTSTERELTTTESIPSTTEELITSSTVASSTLTNIHDDLETTVTTITPSSSVSDLKHEVEYAADAENGEADRVEPQTTTTQTTEENTETDITTTPTTLSSEIDAVEENATQSLLYRNPNNDSQSISVALEADINPDILNDTSVFQSNETIHVTEEPQSTTVKVSTEDVSSDRESSTVPDVEVTDETSTSTQSTSDVTETTESPQDTSSDESVTSATITTDDVTSPTTTEDTVTEQTTNYPTTRSYREGTDDGLTVSIDVANETKEEMPLNVEINANNDTNDYSVEQSFSVAIANRSDISKPNENETVEVYAKNDDLSTDNELHISTTEALQTTQNTGSESSSSSVAIDISTEPAVETTSESVKATTSVTELDQEKHLDTTSPSLTNEETTATNETVLEITTPSEGLTTRNEDNSTVNDDKNLTIPVEEDDASEDSDSTMPPLVAADESLFESILHQVLVANVTEDNEEPKEARNLDNDVYPGDDESGRTDGEDQEEEVHVATEEYLSTLPQEILEDEIKEESISTTQKTSTPEDEVVKELPADEDVPDGLRRGPDPNPDWDSPVSHYAYPESNGPHGPRVYIASRSRRDVTFGNVNATLCQWIFKTDPGVPLLLTFKNFSTPDSERCVHHHIAVERSNGYEARWCGEAYESPSHATFARHEIKLRLYSEHDGIAPSGFVAEIQALDMKLLRKAVPKARPLLNHPHH